MTRHASRVTVTRTGTGFRYKHHAHTSHNEYPSSLDAARAAVTYAHSVDWVCIEFEQGTRATNHTDGGK